MQTDQERKLSKALAEFAEAMSMARQLYNHDHREGAAFAAYGAAKLAAELDQFTHPSGLPARGWGTPLAHLHEALESLTRGKTEAILEKVKIGKKPADTRHVLQHRAVVAVAMEVMMDGGMGRDEAAQRIARELKTRMKMAGRSSEDWRAVARWRDEISKYDVGKDLNDTAWDAEDRAWAAAAFNTMMREARGRLGLNPSREASVSMALSHLNRSEILATARLSAFPPAIPEERRAIKG